MGGVDSTGRELFVALNARLAVCGSSINTVVPPADVNVIPFALSTLELTSNNPTHVNMAITAPAGWNNAWFTWGDVAVCTSRGKKPESNQWRLGLMVWLPFPFSGNVYPVFLPVTGLLQTGMVLGIRVRGIHRDYGTVGPRLESYVAIG